jgi:hypothetical protein
MRCSRVEQLLPAYLDGDLPDHLYRHVSDHLEDCGRCRTQEAAQRRAVRALDSGRHTLAIDLWADFSRRLEAEAGPRPAWWRHVWQPGLATVVAAVVVTVVAQTAPSPPRLATSPSTSPAPLQVASLPNRPLQSPALESALTRKTDQVHERDVAHPARPKYRAPRLLPANVTSHTGRRSRYRMQIAAVAFDALSRSTTSAERARLHGPIPDAVALPHLVAGSNKRNTAPELAQTPPRVTLAAVPRAGDPLDVAQALVTAQQAAASEQMRGELMLLAKEVTRVGGEPAVDGASHAAAGT